MSHPNTLDAEPRLQAVAKINHKSKAPRARGPCRACPQGHPAGLAKHFRCKPGLQAVTKILYKCEDPSNGGVRHKACPRRHAAGGDGGDRTHDLLNAIQALSRYVRKAPPGSTIEMVLSGEGANLHQDPLSLFALYNGPVGVRKRTRKYPFAAIIPYI